MDSSGETAASLPGRTTSSKRWAGQQEAPPLRARGAGGLLRLPVALDLQPRDCWTLGTWRPRLRPQLPAPATPAPRLLPVLPPSTFRDLPARAAAAESGSCCGAIRAQQPRARAPLRGRVEAPRPGGRGQERGRQGRVRGAIPAATWPGGETQTRKRGGGESRRPHPREIRAGGRFPSSDSRLAQRGAEEEGGAPHGCRRCWAGGGLRAPQVPGRRPQLASLPGGPAPTSPHFCLPEPCSCSVQGKARPQPPLP